MKLTITKETLSSGLAKVAGIIERKNTIQILANIKYQADDTGLTLTGTDLEMEITTKIDADVTEPGAGTVSADMLSNIVKRLKAGSQVTMHDDGKGHLHVSSGKSRFDFATLPVDQYPSIAVAITGDDFTIPAADLGRLFAKTAFAMSTEETRYYLNGVYLHPSDDGVTAVATNGHMLGKAWTDAAATFPGVIVPRKAVGEMRKVLDIGDVAVTVSAALIRFDLGDTVIVSKVIDGTFPDYASVIPKGLPDTFRVDAKTFANAAALVSMVSEEKDRGVSMKVTPDAVNLSSSGIHKAEDEIEAHVTGRDATMGFSSKYLADVLAQADGGAVDLSYDAENPMSPALVTATDDEQWLAVVMPRRG
jgi:DNA polymerase III subunit beta